MAACCMSQNFDYHTPVLLEETVDNLVTNPGGIYVDATFGRGNHARAILNRLNNQGRLIAFDKDMEAVFFGKKYFAGYKQFIIIHRAFKSLLSSLQNLGVDGQVSGILFDLGVSSPQLDDPKRGFSFSKPGVLDMRMDTTQGLDAKTWLAAVNEETLADVLWRFGEERQARRIARAIITARIEQPIETTDQLAKIIKFAIPKPAHYQSKHPATQSFQAIRIFINQEIAELEAALQQAYDALAVGGRIAVISFHSLEDRIVKQFIKQHEKGDSLPRGLPIKNHVIIPKLKNLGKPVRASVYEVDRNPRARSAILRIAEKQS